MKNAKQKKESFHVGRSSFNDNVVMTDGGNYPVAVCSQAVDAFYIAEALNAMERSTKNKHKFYSRHEVAREKEMSAKPRHDLNADGTTN